MSEQPPKNEQNNNCSFCGKSKNQVVKTIAGDKALICNECIEILSAIVLDGDIFNDSAIIDDGLDFEDEFRENLLKPTEIKEKLDQYIVGQDDAKKALCVAVYNHYKRILCISGDDNEAEIQKSNVLLLGPSGCGKTLLAQTLAKIIHVPFAIADATTLTEAGYVGEDVENILLRLIQAADHDLALASRGIIYVDEIDKIARKSENASITRDVSGEGVQQALLKIVEGTVANIPPQGGRKHPNQECIPLDTKNILFICGGAFDGIEKIIEKRTQGSALGFESGLKTQTEKQDEGVYSKIEPWDFVKFGLIPELVGRLPIISNVNALDKDAMLLILSKPKNSLVKQYKRLFAFDNIKLEFTKGALEEIAEKAVERKTGARGLRSVMEKLMQEFMFNAPGQNIDKIIIDKKTVIDNI